MLTLGSGVGVCASLIAAIGDEMRFAPMGCGIALPCEGVATDGRATGTAGSAEAAAGWAGTGAGAGSAGGFAAGMRGAVVRAGAVGKGGRAGTGGRGGVGTVGFAITCDARGIGVGVFDATTGAGGASLLPRRSRAESRSSSSDGFDSPTRDHHCRSMLVVAAM